MGQYYAGCCDYVLSWLVFIIVAPVLVLLFIPLSILSFFGSCFWQSCCWSSCCCTPSLIVQSFAGWVLTGCLARTYLGVLLIRLCGQWDLVKTGVLFLFTKSQRMWTDDLDPSTREYYDKTLGRNIILWANLRVGSYKECRELVLDPKRSRTRALDGWICGFAKHQPNLPIFFDTGSEYHTAFRKVVIENLLGRPSVKKALENEGAGLAKIAEKHLKEWLSASWGVGATQKPEYSKLVMPVVAILMDLLFEVESMPAELVDAFSDLVRRGAAYFLLPPWTPYGLLETKIRALGMLKDFLSTHCNAAKPDTKRGLAVDWEGLAAQIPGFLPESDTGPAADPSDAFLQATCAMLSVAGVTGTCNGLFNVMNWLVQVDFFQATDWPGTTPTWKEGVDHMASLYWQNPIDFIIEALRFNCPVAGSHKVLTEEMKCPFLNKETTFPKNTVVMANFNTAHLDPAEWGDDALDFRPGRRPRDRYLIWNGPFGESAPRQCPGEQIAVHLLKVTLDAFFGHFKPKK